VWERLLDQMGDHGARESRVATLGSARDQGPKACGRPVDGRQARSAAAAAAVLVGADGSAGPEGGAGALPTAAAAADPTASPTAATKVSRPSPGRRSTRPSTRNASPTWQGRGKAFAAAQLAAGSNPVRPAAGAPRDTCDQGQRRHARAYEGAFPGRRLRLRVHLCAEGQDVGRGAPRVDPPHWHVALRSGARQLPSRRRAFWTVGNYLNSGDVRDGRTATKFLRVVFDEGTVADVAPEPGATFNPLDVRRALPSGDSCYADDSGR
jgi:hypothetical protein